MTQSMLKTFHGPEGRRHLIDALISQPLIRDKDLAMFVEPFLKLADVAAGTTIITQGDSDTDLVLILEGECSIAIDGHIVARKRAGEHVGEMAVVDPRMTRSASVTATVDSVIARIVEADFSAVADRYPRLWRRIALELASMLRIKNAGDNNKPGAQSSV